MEGHGEEGQRNWKVERGVETPQSRCAEAARWDEEGRRGSPEPRRASQAGYGAGREGEDQLQTTLGRAEPLQSCLLQPYGL